MSPSELRFRRTVSKAIHQKLKEDSKKDKEDMLMCENLFRQAVECELNDEAAMLQERMGLLYLRHNQNVERNEKLIDKELETKTHVWDL